MKKIIAFILSVVLVGAMSFMVSAKSDVVELRGNGNNARIFLNNVQISNVRPNNNTLNVIKLDDGTVVEVFVRGNSISNFNVIRSSGSTAPEAEKETPASAAPAAPADVNGGSGNAPNHSSGGLGVQRIGNVEIRGNGNSARIYLNGVQIPNSRPANNTWSTFTLPGVATVRVFVRGNAILDTEVTYVTPQKPVPYEVSRSEPAVINETSKIYSENVNVVRSAVLSDVKLGAHIYQLTGNTNDVRFRLGGKLATTTVTTTTTVMEYTYYLSVTVTYSDNSTRNEVTGPFTRKGNPVEDVKSTTVNTNHAWTDMVINYQNNYFNNPRQFVLGPVTFNFQPIGNTDVRVFNVANFNDKIVLNDVDTVIEGGIFYGNNAAPNVTWSHHNGSSGNSVWNR